MDTSRRKLLQQLVSTTNAVFILSHEPLLHTEAWERLSFAINGNHQTDEPALEHLEAVTSVYWELYRDAHAKVDLLGGASGHLYTITQLLRSSQPAALQKRLYSLASNAAQIVGEIYYDMDQLESAEAYYTLATETAREVDDPTLQATALGRKGFLFVYTGRYEKALPYFQKAFSLAGNTATGNCQSWLAMMEAEALSYMKRKDACFSALEKTEQVFDNPTREEKGWILFTDTKMKGYKAACYVRLQLPDKAQPLLLAALSRLSPGPTHRRSLLLSDLATTYLQQKQIEEACDAASQALTCAAQAKSSRSLRRLRDFQSGLREWKDVASVKQFNKYLKIIRQA